MTEIQQLSMTFPNQFFDELCLNITAQTEPTQPKPSMVSMDFKPIQWPVCQAEH